MSHRIKIEKSDPPETKIVLAEAIVNIGNAAKKLAESGVNRHAVVVLLQAATKLSRRDITRVLDSLNQLESWYCR